MTTSSSWSTHPLCGLRHACCRILPLAAIVASGGALLASPAPGIILLAPAQLWQRTEFRIDGAPQVTNCFDSDLIQVDATFTLPSRQSMTVPAFWYQEYSRELTDGSEVLTPVGAPHWRARFVPTETGRYQVSVIIHTNGVIAGDPVVMQFQVPAASRAGRLGYPRVAANHRDLETSDGKPLRLLGHNVCWADGRGTFNYDLWFGEMKSAGENFARLWLAPWFLALEHKPGTLNRYDLAGSWQLDRIFEQAEAGGIYLMLCLDHHGMYQVDNPGWSGSNNFWKNNPYNQLNGGPCSKPNDFFTDAAARALYRKRLRYLVARYGYCPNLLAWQFFNEIDNVYGPLNPPDVLAWHRDMGRWLRANDPWHHLMTTSLTGGSERPEMWSLPEMDLAMYHSYAEPSPGKGAAALAASFLKQYGKPMMIGEFGVDGRSWDIGIDPHLRGFRQALWGGALGGSVGTAMSWWWQDLQQDDVYPLFGAMHRILQEGGWDDAGWIAAEFAQTNSPPPDLTQRVPGADPFSASIALNAFRRLGRKMPGAIAVANRLAADRASEHLSAYLRGAREDGLQRAIRMVAFFGDKARLSFRVKAVASDAELTVRVDGVESLRTNFTGADATVTRPREVNADFTVNLDPGKRTIEIANTAGAEWILLDSVRLDQVQPAEYPGGWTYSPEVVGLRTADRALVYVYSPWVVFPAGALRYNPPLLNGQFLRLTGWPEGQFRARWFDPRTGIPVATTQAAAEASVLALPIPSFREDLAAIVSAVRE